MSIRCEQPVQQDKKKNDAAKSNLSQIRKAIINNC